MEMIREAWAAAPVLTLLALWFAVISFVSVVVTMADKRRAKRGAWRVPENTLLALAALGGSAAMYGTMLLIRHKTRHVKFMLGIPLILLFQGIAVLWLWKRMHI